MVVTKIRAFLLLMTVPITASIAEPLVHVLEKGETLYSLARNYGVELAEILETNDIVDPGALSVGMRITIPGDISVPSSPGPVVHTVAPGETYYGISRQYGLTVDQLLALNSRDDTRVLRPGETLVVSTGSAAPRQISPELSPVAVVPNTPRRVDGLPDWPVAGTMTHLTGKLSGVAIEAAPSSYVHAVASGKVVWTGPYRGFGQVVLIDNDGYIFLYGGNEDLFVNVGQIVAAGSRIGRLSRSDPRGRYEEMIFSVFRDGKPVPPETAPRG